MNAAQLDEHTLAVVLADLALILIAATVCAQAARRIRQPSVIGEIIAGLALGPSLLGLLPGNLTDTLFPTDARAYLKVLAQLGLVLFMFGMGYRINTSHLRGSGRQIIVVSLASVTVPFALGMGLAIVLHPWYNRLQMASDDVLGPALFLGAAMSITAFPVLARIVAERGMHRDRLGSTSLACASVQDFLAWCVLAAVVGVVTASGMRPLVRLAIESVVFITVVGLLVRPALTWLLAPRRRWSGTFGGAIHPLLVCCLLLCAWSTAEIGLHPVFGAFAFGAAVPREQVEKLSPEAPVRIEQASMLLLPVFFAITGLSVNLTGLGPRGVLEVVLVVAVACVGKFFGAFGSARLCGFGARDSVVLGVLLNTRGLTELIILDVGLSIRVIDGKLFTAMVVMAVVTTLAAGPLLDRIHWQSEPEPSTETPTEVPTGGASQHQQPSAEGKFGAPKRTHPLTTSPPDD